MRKGEGGRIGGDVVSYVEYVIAAVYEDAERKKNLSYLLQAFRHPSHYTYNAYYSKGMSVK
jgi:hypothetical protein